MADHVTPSIRTEGDESWLEMGEGHIPTERLAEEVRPMRHNLRTLRTIVDGQQVLVRDAVESNRDALKTAGAADARSTSAHELAREARDRVVILERDLFGHPDRPNDRGALGGVRAEMAELRQETREAMRHQSAQNYAILGSILGLIAAIAASLLLLLHH